MFRASSLYILQYSHQMFRKKFAVEKLFLYEDDGENENDEWQVKLPRGEDINNAISCYHAERFSVHRGQTQPARSSRQNCRSIRHLNLGASLISQSLVGRLLGTLWLLIFCLSPVTALRGTARWDSPQIFSCICSGDLCLQPLSYKCVDSIIAFDHWTATFDILPVKYRYLITNYTKCTLIITCMITAYF